jgi:hypothetical protein
MSVDEDVSKDRFFERAGELAQEMIAAHGKGFRHGGIDSDRAVHRRG